MAELSSEYTVTRNAGMCNDGKLTDDMQRLQTNSTAACRTSARTSFMKSSNDLNNLHTITN